MGLVFLIGGLILIFPAKGIIFSGVELKFVSKEDFQSKVITEEEPRLNVLNIDSIKNALFEMLKSAYVRDKKARLSYEIAKEFSWSRCASETFNFISFVLKKSKD